MSCRRGEEVEELRHGLGSTCRGGGHHKGKREGRNHAHLAASEGAELGPGVIGPRAR